MSYAIQTLREEAALIEKSLSNWDIDHYPEAHKIRNARLKNLEESIEILKNSSK